MIQCMAQDLTPRDIELFADVIKLNEQNMWLILTMIARKDETMETCCYKPPPPTLFGAGNVMKLAKPPK